MRKPILGLISCALALAVALPSAGQGTINFRSVSSELSARPRGGVIDLFSQGSRPQSDSTGDVDPWFWDNYATTAGSSDATRMLEAGRTAAGHAPYSVEVTAVQALLSGFAGPLRQAQRDHNVSAALIVAVIYAESRGRVTAISPAGAIGLMQLMPDTARYLGVADSFNATQNIDGGSRYLDELLSLHDDDPLLALASYNAGPGAVQRAGGVPNFAETRSYVPKVLAAWHVARSLCGQAPDTARAPCDFATAGTFAAN